MHSLIILQAGGSSILGSFAPMLIVLVIIYFFFIRPQATKQKQQQAFMEGLAKGQEVVTSSGVIGRINKIDDREVQLAVDQKTFIRFTKGAISREMTEAYTAKTETK